MKNAYQTLVDLANEALKHRKSEDSKAFKNCIDEMIAIKGGNFYKADLVSLIASDGYQETDTWIDDFILYDLNYASGERTALLLEMLLMIGVNNPEERYKRELVAALSRTLDTEDFYTIENGIMSSQIPDEFIPNVFNKEVEWSNLNKRKNWEPTAFYIMDDQGRISINSSHLLVSETINFYNHYQRKKNSTDEEPYYDEVYDEYPDYHEHVEGTADDYTTWGQEIEFRDCFDDDENPIVEELEKISCYNAKARHLLLQLDGKNYTAWFEHFSWV